MKKDCIIILLISFISIFMTFNSSYVYATNDVDETLNPNLISEEEPYLDTYSQEQNNGEQETTMVSIPKLDIDWEIELITNYKRGFIVKTNNKTGNLKLRVADESIAEAKVVDSKDSRGYYCEIIGKRAGTTKLIAEDSGTIIEKQITVSDPQIRLNIDWDIQLITNYKRGFIVQTNHKTENLKLRVADESIAEAKVINKDDSRGYYCEIVGKRTGTTKLIVEDAGTIIEKEITVSGPSLDIPWNVNLVTNYKRGFIVQTNHKTGNLKLRVADESIAEAKVVNSEDSRGYYCEIVGKRAGTTKLIVEDSGTIIEKDVTVSGPSLEIPWDVNLITNYKRGFIVKTNYKTGNLTLRVDDGSIAEAKVVDSKDSRGYYCEIVGKRAGTTKLIAEDSGTIIEKEITVSAPSLDIPWNVNLVTNYKRGFIVKTNGKTGKLTLRVDDGSIAEAKVVDSKDSRGYYCEIIGKKAGTTKLIAEDSGTIIEKEITVKDPNIFIDWKINLIPNYKRGFIVRTNHKTGNLTLRVVDGSIAEAKVVNKDDSRGYYCEIVGKKPGNTMLIATDGETEIYKNISVQSLNYSYNYYYSQTDPRWSGLKYGYYSFGSTGCVPTAFSMALASINNTEIWVPTVANWIYNNTQEFNKRAIGTSGLGVYLMARSYGLQIDIITSESQLREVLSHGKMVVGMVGTSKYAGASWTHAILLHGISGNYTTVYDPLNSSNNGYERIDYIYSHRSSDTFDYYQGSCFFALYK